MQQNGIIMTQSNPNYFISLLAKLIIKYSKTSIALSLILMIALLTSLPNLYKDTRADAFLAKDNPALLYKDKVKEQFGLSDPIIVAVVNQSEQGVFNPKSLSLVHWLSENMSSLENINSDRVTSLSTENNITGTEIGMEVEPFFDSLPENQQQADEVWQKVSDFPLYMGNLVSKNKKATLIVAELIDEEQVESTYLQILELVKNAPVSQNDEIHVAGEGAVAGYLGSYIDSDAQRLNPMAGIIITLIILFAFRRLSPGLLANVIIAASVLMTLSIMAISDVPFFVITNALPVILIGISVADSVHMFSHYFELHAKQPAADKQQLIIKTIEEMWRPITLTTLTTIAGFIGLYFAAYVPPFKYFGLFTAIGVAIAWLYSLVFLPAAMSLLKPSASNYFIRLSQANQIDRFSKFMINLGRITLNNPTTIILIFSTLIVSGLVATSQLRVNEDRIETFHHSEPLYQADKIINENLNGTTNLDIVIEAKENEGLFNPEYLKKIEALQEYALSMENVRGATSIVDYLKQMNRSLNGGHKNRYELPSDRALIAQYFLIYSASSEPTDFEEEVDYDYRVANIRLNLNKGGYVEIKQVLENLDLYIKTQFNTSAISATLSGRASVNYHWIKDLGESHFVGLAISMFLVWTVSAVLFGSLSAGLYAIIPVASSLLFVYTSMVVLSIDLGIGTSMFASVAIGLGVDFAIHTIDRLRSLFQQNNGDWELTLTQLYPSTGRALFFNYLAIACGFGVLISSQVVPLTNFGTIVVVSVTTSFLASMSLLPALIKVTKPKFISRYHHSETQPSLAKNLLRISSVIFLVAVLGGFAITQQVHASDISSQLSQALPNANELVKKINSIDDGKFVTRNLTMKMIDKRGKVRTRETRGYRKYFDGEKRTILFYKKPTNVKNTAFLTFDYPDSEKDDDQWLYLPALRKVRRISASDRGDYFLGTDFTYEDIKLEGKLDTSDFHFKTLKLENITLDDQQVSKTALIQGLPKSDKIARELGYGKTEISVDLETNLIVKASYWGPKNKLLKTLSVSNIKIINGIMTRNKLIIDNHKTGHRTEFQFSQVDYNTPVKDSLFSQRAMKKGQ